MARCSPRRRRLHLSALRLLQGARRVCALSGYASEVVERRTPKTPSLSAHGGEVEAHFFHALSWGNTTESSDRGVGVGVGGEENEFVAFN